MSEASEGQLTDFSGRIAAFALVGSRPERETERCPNCGKLCWIGECRYSSSIKTPWGGSTLHGVCESCARCHSAQGENVKDEVPDVVQRVTGRFA